MALPMVEAGDPRCSLHGEGRDATLCRDCLDRLVDEFRWEFENPDWPDQAPDTLL